MKDKENHKIYLEEAKYDYGQCDEQIREAAEDMRFSVVPGGMWEKWQERSYENRAKMELDYISESVHNFIAEYDDNRVEVKYSPDDDATSDEDAEVLQGLFRRDFRTGNGRIAKDNAIFEAAVCGYGAYELCHEYVDEETPEDTRQKVAYRQITNAHSCLIWESGSKFLDKADANHVNIIEEFDKKTLERLYPDHGTFETALTPQDTRMLRFRGKHSVYIMTRYQREKKMVKASVWMNPITGTPAVFYDDDIEMIKDDLKLEGYEYRHDKKMPRFEVERSLMDGNGFIESPDRVAGKYLPIIPVYAYRGYIDGREYYYGLVRKNKDAQRLINMNVSNLAEISSTDDTNTPIVDPQSIAGYEREWSADRSKVSYLQRRRYVENSDGTPLDTGPVEYMQGRQINAATIQLMEFTSGHLREKTGEMIYEAQKSDMSGRALRQLIKRLNKKTRPIFTNIETATRREGLVYNAMAAEIYANTRAEKVLLDDGTEKMVVLNQRVADKDTGQIVVINNVSKMKFEVVVETGQNYDTVREETVESLRSLMAEMGPDHEYYDICLFMLINTLSGVGIEVLKDYNRKQMLLRGIVEPNEDDPEEMAMVQNSQNQTDPQQELTKAATEQQLAESENLRASSVEKKASAELKHAQKLKIAADIGFDEEKVNLAKLDGIEKLVEQARPRVLQ